MDGMVLPSTEYLIASNDTVFSSVSIIEASRSSPGSWSWFCCCCCCCVCFDFMGDRQGVAAEEEDEELVMIF